MFSIFYSCSRLPMGVFSVAVFLSMVSSWDLLAQESLPGLKTPFDVPPAIDNRGSPFQDEVQQSSERSVAKSSSEALNHLFSHQWVKTDVAGNLSGTVVTLVGQDSLSVSGVSVTLAQRGRSVSSVESNVDGEFVFGNVAPGYYSIIAQADNSFATYGLAVMNSDSGSHLPSLIELRVIRPKGEGIQRMLNVNMVPNQLSGALDMAARDPISSTRVFAKSHRVLASKNGRVVGQLSQLGIAPELNDMSQMRAMLLKEGAEVSQSSVAKDGTFYFDGIEPGCYGFTAAGNRGVAAVAFCVVKPDSLTLQLSNDQQRLVAALQDSAEPQLNVELADAADVMSVQETVTPEEVVSEEELASSPMFPMGGSNMFGAGQVISGGGSGGIGGGLSGLAGLGALGGLAYALANDDEDTNNNAVASPIVVR